MWSAFWEKKFEFFTEFLNYDLLIIFKNIFRKQESCYVDFVRRILADIAIIIS